MILNVYKPRGWTSFDVVKKLKGILGVEKIGHAGTLDPLAEGVLIVLSDSDTKRQKGIMAMEKEYLAEIAFGAITDTYDLEGDLVIAEEIPDVDEVKEKLKKVISSYIGKIIQKPPLYSAVKIGGTRLYKIARGRKRIEKELPLREVEIYNIKLEETSDKIISKENLIIKLPVAVMRITCSKGTYIRSLANDLGEALGYGGVLVNLVRTRIGDYKVEESKKLEDFKKK